jgi:hypothetical protein
MADIDRLEVRDYELTTKRAVLQYLNINDDTPESFIAVRLMKAATDFIEGQLVSSDIMQGGFCNRRFLATDYTLAKYTGDNYRDLLLRQYPINSITTIIIDDTTEFPSGASTLKDLDFYIDTETQGNIINANIWPAGDPLNLEITYNAGFTAIPFDLEMAAIGLVALKWQKKGQELMKSEKIGQYSYTLADINSENPFNDEVIRQTLERYRVPCF